MPKPKKKPVKKRSTKGQSVKNTGREVTQFKEGGPPGPGRPKLPDDIRLARQALKISFERIGMKQLYATRSELRVIIDSPKSTALELATARILIKAITDADYRRLDFILDRLIGTIPRQTDLTFGVSKQTDLDVDPKQLGNVLVVVQNLIQTKRKSLEDDNLLPSTERPVREVT